MHRSLFHFRDDPAIRGRSVHLTICTNQVTFDPPLEILQKPFAFSLGRPVYPKQSSIPIVNTGAGELFPLTVQPGAIFAEAGLALRIEGAVKELVQLFPIENATGVPEGLPESLLASFEMRRARMKLLPLADYRLINLTHQVDCLDSAPSNFDCDSCETDLVVDEAKVEPGDLLFRVARKSSLVLVTELGRKKLIEAGVPATFFGREIFEEETP